MGEIFALGHDAKKVRFLRIIDNATVVELFFIGVFKSSFTKFVSDGNLRIIYAPDKGIVIFGLGEKIKGFFRHVLIEIRGVVKNAKKSGKRFDR